METRVTLRPGEKSTKALVAEHGHRLVCVRYRYDAAAQVRYKTMELVVDQVPWGPGAHAADPEGRPPSQVGVRVAYEDRALRQRIRQLGGRRGAGAAPVGAAAPHREALGTAGPEGAGPRWRRDWP